MGDPSRPAGSDTVTAVDIRSIGYQRPRPATSLDDDAIVSGKVQGRRPPLPVGRLGGQEPAHLARHMHGRRPGPAQHDECSRLPIAFDQGEPAVHAQDPDGSVEAIGMDAVPRDDSHGDVVEQPRARHRVDDMGVPAAIDVQMLLGVARRGHRGVRQPQDRRDGRVADVAVVNPDAPAGLIGRRAAEREVATHGHQRAPHASARDGGECFARRIALADRPHVELHAGNGEGDRAACLVEPHVRMSCPTRRLLEGGRIRHSPGRARIPPETDDGTLRHIECAIGGGRETRRGLEHGEQVGAHGQRVSDGLARHTAQLALRQVVGQDAVQLTDAVEAGPERDACRIGIRGVDRDARQRAHVGLDALESLEAELQRLRNARRGQPGATFRRDPCPCADSRGRQGNHNRVSAKARIHVLRSAFCVLEIEQPLRVVVQQLALDGLAGREPPDRGQRLRTLTLLAAADVVVAVAAVQQLVLMPRQEVAREGFVARQGIESRAGRQVAVHVRVVAQIAVRETARRHGSLRVEDRLVEVVRVDVGPPRLRVADEGHARVRRQHRVEPLEAVVVHAELPVHQHRHAARRGQAVDRLHLRSVAGHAELLLRDDHGPARQLAGNLVGGAVEIGHVVGPEQELARMRRREGVTRIVAEGLRLQAVRSTVVRGWASRGASRRQEDGGRDPHRPLVGEQHVVWPAAVADVLVDVYDGLSCRLRV